MTATAPPLILIAEDDAKTAALLSAYLQRDGYGTVTALDGRSALEQFSAKRPQLVILDVMMPLVDGWEVCREIRKTSSTPILFLTARDEESDRVLGLGLGGDDYVVKPFSPREIVARVKAILRRASGPQPPLGDALTHGPLTVDVLKRRVFLAGEPISLTPLEYTLLTSLMAAPGHVLKRDELLSRLYPHGEAVIDRVVDVHIGKLRQKIEADPAQPELIVTVRGIGYRFADSSGEATP